jgi:hypothetical protein
MGWGSSSERIALLEWWLRDVRLLKVRAVSMLAGCLGWSQKFDWLWSRWFLRMLCSLCNAYTFVVIGRDSYMVESGICYSFRDCIDSDNVGRLIPLIPFAMCVWFNEVPP